MPEKFTGDASKDELLVKYGIPPFVARAYIENRYRMSPERIQQVGGLYSHAEQAMLVIATGAEPELLEDVYGAIREAFEEEERQARIDAGYDEFSYSESVEDRRNINGLREDSLALLNWYDRHQIH